MSQVLERATAILDALGEKPLWRLGELAERTGLAPATCSRLVSSLAALGWVDGVTARGPYRLGPRLQALAERQPYRAGLVAAIGPWLDIIAQDLRQPAVLVRLRGSRRQVLLCRAPVAGAVHGEMPLEDLDLYVTATGRLLLAHMEPRRRDRLIDRLGLPRRREWPGVCDRHELLAELRELRRTGTCRHDTSGWHSIAAWIGRWDGEGACIGTFAEPGELDPRSEELLKEVQRTLVPGSGA